MKNYKFEYTYETQDGDSSNGELWISSEQEPTHEELVNKVYQDGMSSHHKSKVMKSVEIEHLFLYLY